MLMMPFTEAASLRMVCAHHSRTSKPFPGNKLSDTLQLLTIHPQTGPHIIPGSQEFAVHASKAPYFQLVKSIY